MHKQRVGALVVVTVGMLWCAAAVPQDRAGKKSSRGQTERIRLVPNEEERRVDVLIEGQPFTSYIYPTSQKKPSLYPLRTASGVVVTRGFPLDPHPGERVDHPHHVGLWFNYGSVNGLDFWNNSDAIKPAERGKMGTILHRSISALKSGADQGELQTEMDWVDANGKPILREHAQFIFRGGAGFRGIDRIATLEALDDKVVFADDKEGVIGIRVTHALEAPSTGSQSFIDSKGQVTKVDKMDNTGVNGVYLTSEGVKGEAVWGTQGRWCILSGKVEGQPATIAILDHPQNPGFPTYWHARGYGLFAANPLGRKIFSNGKEELNFTLAPHATVTFRYRILILSEIATAERAEAAYQKWAASK